MKLFQEGESEHLWPFYLSNFLIAALYFVAPFEILYFSSLGFSAVQIGFLIAVFPLAVLLFEIPTGAIADLYGRKFSVILGFLSNGLILLMIFFFQKYYALLGLFALSGIAFTLTSGSSEAWVVDLLKAVKKNTLIKVYFSKSRSMINLGFVLSGIIGALVVASIGLRSLWIVASISFLLGGFILMFGKEDNQNRKEVKIKDSFKETYIQIKNSAKYGRKNSILYFLFGVSLIFGVIGSLEGMISWTPFLKSFNFPDYAFGYMWAAVGVIGVIAPLISSKAIKKKNERNLLMLVAFLTIIYGITVLFSPNIIVALLALGFGSFLLDFEVPIWSNYLNRIIPSKKRATILSMRSMLFSLGGIIALPFAGYLVDTIGGRWTIFISTLFMIPSLILYSRIKEKKI